MMRSCVDKTYQEILQEYLRQNYMLQVTPYEQERIHRRWKELGKTAWNNSIGWKY